jgi:adenylate cyclase
MWRVAIDFDAEGLLDGAPDARARQARLELLCALEAEGFGLEQLRQATVEGRLALLPLERMLEGEGPFLTQEEVAERTGLSVEFLREAQRALGAPLPRPGEPDLTEEDLELTKQAAMLLAAGLSEEAFLELTRVMSRAMASVAAAFTSLWGEALMRPGDTERDLGLRYAESMESLGPMAGPALQRMLNMRMRERVRQAVVGQAELSSGRLPGAQPIIVAFADIVGFTRLGEEVPPEELGEVIGRFERLAIEVAEPPVQLVKTIGDAAMLVSSQADPLVAAALTLVERSLDEEIPLSRAGVAAGEALPRAGDYYGRPVNLASRLTAFARKGSVVVSSEVRDRSSDAAFSWSFAGRRRFKGVNGEVEVYRARRPAAPPTG